MERPWNYLKASPATRRLLYDERFGTLRPGERQVASASCRVAASGHPGRVTVLLTDQRLYVRRPTAGRDPDESPLLSFEGRQIIQVRQAGGGGSGQFVLTLQGSEGESEVHFSPGTSHSVSAELAQNLYQNIAICVAQWQQGRVPFG